MLSNQTMTSKSTVRTLSRALVIAYLLVWGLVFDGREFPAGASKVAAQEQDPKPLTNKELSFFESRIRPVLVKACYDCHSVSAGQAEGGLLLDSREGMLRGGESGPVLVAGDVRKSLLLKRISTTDTDSVMPPKEHADRLAASVVKDFATWVKLGAPDPRREPTGAKDLRNEIGKTDEAAKQWWSYQPLLRSDTHKTTRERIRRASHQRGLGLRSTNS